jgi:hypothetical protein
MRYLPVFPKEEAFSFFGKANGLLQMAYGVYGIDKVSNVLCYYYVNQIQFSKKVTKKEPRKRLHPVFWLVP